VARAADAVTSHSMALSLRISQRGSVQYPRTKGQCVHQETQTVEEGVATRVSEVSLDGVDRRLRMFRAGHEVDTFVLLTRRYAVAVDTMSTPEEMTAVMELVRDGLAGRQLLVVNTHADYDHAWGNAVFATPDGAYPAPIIAHRHVAERLRDPAMERYLRQRQQAEPRYAAVRLIPPTVTFSDRLRIDGGDLTLELIPTPGHTDDHVAVWIPELRLLLAGDAAEQPIPYVNAPSDLPTLRASIRLLAALDPATVIPCHGGTTDPGLLARNLAYFDLLDRTVGSAAAEGRVPRDWATRENLPDALGLPYEEALRAVGIDPATVSEPDFYRASHLRAVRAVVANLSPPH